MSQLSSRMVPLTVFKWWADVVYEKSLHESRYIQLCVVTIYVRPHLTKSRNLIRKFPISKVCPLEAETAFAKLIRKIGTTTPLVIPQSAFRGW